MECFRRGETTFNPDNYTVYSMVPYYEHFAFSASVVLEEINKYIKSDHKILTL